jgi:hypothetical protein
VTSKYKLRLVGLQCIGILMFLAMAWLVNALGGCRVYGLPDCAQKEQTLYNIAFVAGLVPLVLSIFLGRITYIPLFLLSILSSIFFFPLGSVIGVLSIHALLKYRAESKARARAT